MRMEASVGWGNGLFRFRAVSREATGVVLACGKRLELTNTCPRAAAHNLVTPVTSINRHLKKKPSFRS